jgi:hypothetical protein
LPVPVGSTRTETEREPSAPLQHQVNVLSPHREETKEGRMEKLTG